MNNYNVTYFYSFNYSELKLTSKVAFGILLQLTLKQCAITNSWLENKLTTNHNLIPLMISWLLSLILF